MKERSMMKKRKCVVCKTQTHKDTAYSRQGQNWTCRHCVKSEAERLEITEAEYLETYVRKNKKVHANKREKILQSI